MMKQTVVYEIKNTLNSHRYIGSTCEGKEHWRRYRYLLRNKKHHNSVLQAAWSLYGEEVFCFNILEVCTSKDTLLEREQYYLDVLLPEYNVAKLAGSNRGVHFEDSDETRLHKSLGHLGLEFTEEHRHNMALAATGKHHNRGIRNGRSKLTEQDVIAIRNGHSTGMSQSDLARAFGVGQTQISNIILRVCWGSIA